MRRWSALGLSLCCLLPVSAAPPTDSVDHLTAYYRCSQVGGDMNDSASGAGADYAHTLTCSLDANLIRLGTVVKACALVNVTTGSSAPPLTLKLKAGSTTLVAPTTATPMNNNVAGRTGVLCYRTVGSAAPSVSAQTYSAPETPPTNGSPSETNGTPQPVALATNGVLVWTFVSRWDSAGTGTNTLTLNAFSVELTNY